jgi:hypothetical protein
MYELSEACCLTLIFVAKLWTGDIIRIAQTSFRCEKQVAVATCSSEAEELKRRRETKLSRFMTTQMFCLSLKHPSF